MGALAKFEEFDLAVAKLHRLDFLDELVVFLFVVVVIAVRFVGEVLCSGKNPSRIGRQERRPDVLAQIVMLLKPGTGTGIGILRPIPADAEVVQIGALHPGTNAIGLAIDDLDRPAPVILFAPLPGLMGEIPLNDLKCPQRIAPKISLVAYFAGALQDSGEEFFDPPAIFNRVQQHSHDVMNAGEVPTDAGTEAWIARLHCLPDGGMVGIGEEWIIP
jgi:hypothetical protein